MFTEDDGDFKAQVTCDVPECPELDSPAASPSLSAITNGGNLNVILGSTILQGWDELPKIKVRGLRRSMLDAREDFLVKECGYEFPERNVDTKVRLFLACFTFAHPS